MKKILKLVLILLLIIIAAVLAFVVWLSITEFKPEDVEPVEVRSVGETGQIDPEQELSVLSWNIGYAGLGAESDFFMDGGENVQAADEAKVKEYLANIRSQIESIDADITLLQEVDLDSKRTYRIDQAEYLSFAVNAHAKNYACDFVPIPWPPMGRVHSGVFTTTMGLQIDKAERLALPCPFSWPVRTANIKRCLLASYMPIEGSDKQLVIVNLHLEAYDSGEGKIAQTRVLTEFIQAEYEKGNYVIAGGDFNQVFPGSLELYPNTHEELWLPGALEEDMLPEDWTLAYDLDTPSCRLLNQPYDEADVENTQHYVIDGFILSPNVEMKSVETLDVGFENSDHNPVLLNVILK